MGSLVVQAASSLLVLGGEQPEGLHACSCACSGASYATLSNSAVAVLTLSYWAVSSPVETALGSAGVGARHGSWCCCVVRLSLVSFG